MVVDAWFYSLLAGICTVIGPLLAWLIPLSRPVISFSFGVSSGVMLLVSYVSLLPAATQSGNFLHIILGMGLALLIMSLFRRLPIGHVHATEEGEEIYQRLGFYVALAVIVHNFPEGIAIGLGFEAEHSAGLLLVLALAIHNIPEGMALALPLFASGYRPWTVLAISLLCGLTLPLGTWLGTYWFAGRVDIASVGLIFAATVMIWIVVYEIFPQAFRMGRRFSIFGLLAGGLFMYAIHTLHG
jgi:ZIP family zinc transporter